MLTATAASGSVFTGWGGACVDATTDATCSLTLNADESVTAGFAAVASPPRNVTKPHVSGTPQAGQQLSCTGDTWSGLGSPQILQAAWFDSTVAETAGHPIIENSQIGNGRTLTLGDYPPGTEIYCTVTANGSTTAQSATVAAQALAPALAPGFRDGQLSKLTPTINSAVEPGGTNTCTPGGWLHYPTTYSFAWYTLPSEISAISAGTLVHRGAKLQVTTSMDDDYIVCQVTARNAGGSGTALSNRYLALEPDYGIHVNAIEVTQGIQTPELPTRSASDPAQDTVSYGGVAITSESPSTAPVTVEFAQDHATVARVYINTSIPLNGAAVPDVVLTAYRNGKELPPGPIGPDELPPASHAVLVGPLGGDASMTNTQRYDPQGAYTFTLPWGWAEGDIKLTATANPVQNPVRYCDSDCLARTLTLTGLHFNPVTQANIYPIAFLSGVSAPKGYTVSDPQIDPAWSIVQDVVPFPIYVHPYLVATDVTRQLTTCDGLTQAANQSNAAFAQAVYARQSADLLQDVANYASANDTNPADYLYGVVPSGVKTTCPNAYTFSGGITSGGSDLAAVDRER